MSFSILCTRPGSFQLALMGDLDTSALSLLRRELATVMSANPREFEVHLPDSGSVGTAGLRLVESFFDIMWARGCRFSFARGRANAVPIGDRPKLRQLLTGREESTATA